MNKPSKSQSVWIAVFCKMKVHKFKEEKVMSKKGENIYKRKDGRWEARYIKSYTPDGKAKYGYCYGRTYHEAKDKVNTARAELISRTPTKETESRKRLAVFCDEWLILKRSKVKNSTYVKYHTVIENHIKSQLGGCCVTSLTSILIEQFAYDLMHENGLSAKTVKDILTVLHAVLLYAEKQSPYLHRIDVVYPKLDKKEMRVLSREEQERFTKYLLTNTDNCKFGTLLTLLTGLRIGEVCALRWCDISLKDGLINIKSTMQRIKNFDTADNTKTKIVISDPKSFSSARVIPLSPFALELCKGFYGNQNAYILTGETDKFIEPRNLQYRMERYAEECGLSGVHFHTLRHSFATRCVEVGFEIKSLSEVLGHASPQITLERYVHSSIELKKENMRKLTAIGY